VFNRERRERRVDDQRSCRLALASHLAQNLPVSFARVQHAGGRLREPGGHDIAGLGHRERAFEHARVGRDSQKRHSVSQAKRTSCSPESVASSQTRLASCSGARRLQAWSSRLASTRIIGGRTMDFSFAAASSSRVSVVRMP
jgi:hypothetical protein